jgi:NADPH-dependent curcumin reductase CurA
MSTVGGEILDLALGQLNPHARIVACGAISAYKYVTDLCVETCRVDSYSAEEIYPIRNYPTLVSMKSEIKGFIAFEYASRYPEAQAYLADLNSKGKISYEYHILEPNAGENGLGRCVEALEGMFDGKNMGKT